MVFDVTVKIQEATTGIGADIQVRLHVEQAPSGLYIASNPAEPTLIAAGISPQYAILDYLSANLYRKSVEAEESVV